VLALQKKAGNAATVGLLQRNTSQTVNDVEYKTESFGTGGERVKSVEGPVHNVGTQGRGATPQPVSGVLPLGYDAGHVLALNLGGQNQGYNVVPMLPGFNRQVWKAVETEISRDSMFVYSGMNFKVKIQVAYPGAASSVPVSLTATGSYDTLDKKKKKVYKTKNYGTKSQPGDIPVVAPLSGSDAEIATTPSQGVYTKAVQHLKNVEKDEDGAAFLETNQHLKPATKAQYPDDPANRPYEYLDILTFAGLARTMPYIAPGKLFTDDQRKLIIQTNKAAHGGAIVSDDPADPHHTLDERGAANAPEVDHIIPKSVGGSNMYSNARVVSWQLNNKEDRVKDISGLVDRSRLSLPALPTSGTNEDKADQFLPGYLMTVASGEFTKEELTSALSRSYTGISKGMLKACVVKLSTMVTDGALELNGSRYKLKK
jgi:hypothetical protein